MSLSLGNGSTPIVYVETNFLVGIKTPHDRLHRSSSDLLRRGEAGDCELKLPYPALLEAGPRIQGSYTELARQAADIKRSFERLRWVRRELVEHVLDELKSAALENYWTEDAQKAQRAALELAERISIPFSNKSQQTMNQLRGRLPELRGKDIIDLAILAQVYEHRKSTGLTRPAILASSNTMELDPASKRHGTKLTEIYDEVRIVFMNLNDSGKGLDEAVGRWTKKRWAGGRGGPEH